MSKVEVVNAILYMHQTSGACAGTCMQNHTHQMEKTEVYNICFKMMYSIITVYIFKKFKKFQLFTKKKVKNVKLKVLFNESFKSSIYSMSSKKYLSKKSEDIIKKTLLLMIVLPRSFQNFWKNLYEFV